MLVQVLDIRFHNGHPMTDVMYVNPKYVVNVFPWEKGGAVIEIFGRGSTYRVYTTEDSNTVYEKLDVRC